MEASTISSYAFWVRVPPTVDRMLKLGGNGRGLGGWSFVIMVIVGIRWIPGPGSLVTKSSMHRGIMQRLWRGTVSFIGLGTVTWLDARVLRFSR
jgi:hypothetical protein